MCEENGFIYRAATNPVLAVRLSGGSRLPTPGYPEELRWCQMPVLAIEEIQEAIYEAIKGLDDRLRQVVIKRFGEELRLNDCKEALGVTSRERVRQLEAHALRKMRARISADLMDRLHDATEVVPIAGGALDPDWVDTQEAARLSGYKRSHICWLYRQGHVVGQVNPLRRSALQISRASLEEYIKRPGDGRKKGQWKENHG